MTAVVRANSVRRPVRPVGLAFAAVVLLCFLGAGCARRDLPTELSAPIDAHPFVVAEGAGLLDAKGHFSHQTPHGAGTNLITPVRAREIAEAAIMMFSSSQRPYLENQRGAPIDFAALRADPRVFFAESPLEQAGFTEIHPGLRKDAGPYYLVTFRDGDRPVLSVAVSAYDTDLDIVNGRIIFPIRHGNDFRIQAVKEGDVNGMPVSPEHAARIAWEAFGARVSSIPQLVLASREYAPHYARWRLRLDRPVSVKSVRGSQVSTRDLYVGMGGALSVAATSQPERVALGNPDRNGRLEARRRPDLPLAFETVLR